jgi:predicted membrane protein
LSFAAVDFAIPAWLMFFLYIVILFYCYATRRRKATIEQ